MRIDMSEKRLQSWKDTFAKSGIVCDTNDEYREAIYNLVGYFDILIEMDTRQKIILSQKTSESKSNA
jgi:hypothetical protein